MEKKKQTHKTPLGLLNIPAKATKAKQDYERIACVFQGGGALGAYQVGAYQAIHERGYHANFLAGVSIGAINSAIIAGNEKNKQIDKLHEFWGMISEKTWDVFFDYSSFDILHHFHNRLGALQTLVFGLDGFFKPRIPPTIFTHTTPENLSYYDTSELRSTLERLVDFDRINSKKITLCLGAVNVETGEMVFFNNQSEIITPEHVMASGALPPGLPAIKIGEKYFWDGGIYANTPLVTVLDALPEQNTLCFVIDCFKLQGLLPQTMDQMDERQKDIRYASHSRRLTNVYSSRQNLQAAIHLLGKYIPKNTKKDPVVKELLKLGHEKRFSVVHVIYNGTPFAHSFKDYNFAESAIQYRLEMGYNDANLVLNKPDWEKKSKKRLACSIYGVPLSSFAQN